MQLQYFVRNALICLGCVIRRKMFLVKYSLKNTPKFCIKIIKIININLLL